MGDFLRRPTLIHTINWLPAGVVDADIDPWTLFLGATEIKKKIDNFAYFRGNMHIKVVVNASPFYYGAMLINYTPTPTFVQPIDNTAVTALVPQSQKPHIWIDLRANMGGEMILPFVWPYNYVTVTNAASVAALGRLRNITYSGLQSANGAAVTGVTVKIYAWMEDIELHGNTTSLAMQAKKQKVDEYQQDGIVSKPATSLAHWASYLVNVPMIGPYAKATQIGASAVASVAGLFGWSKVPVIENVKPVKPLFFHDLASAHISEPMSKMTLDPKAELSIDPRIVSSSTGEDELSIANIVQKDSFLGSTIWYSADAPDTLLYNANISPSMLRQGAAVNTVYTMGFTPMAYIARMFDNWRGDIIFTIKVVASQYHRGRLRLHWDPVPTGITTDISNRTLTKIIDIGECTEIEMRIPYLSYQMWMLTADNVYDGHGTASTLGTFTPAYQNGYMSLRVLNNLSAPIDTANVTVMLFVRGAENLEFANPKPLLDTMQPYVVQALVENVVEDDQQKSTPLVDRYLVNWGEAVPSLRLMLQRSCLSQTLYFGQAGASDTGAALQQVFFQQTRFPTPPGYDPYSATSAKGVVAPANNYPYSWTEHNPLTWITPMFVARRGSIQWHFHVNDQNKLVTSLRCTRDIRSIANNSSNLIGEYATVVAAGTTRSTAQRNMYRFNWESLCGTVKTDCRVNPSISLEMPQMTRQRYAITKPLKSTVGYTEDGTDADTYNILAFLKTYAYVDLQSLFMEKYCNAGTDFSLSFFLCAPQMYYCTGAGAVPV